MRWNGVFIGDPLTDNMLDPDGYRFHDVFHFAHAAILHWSPTFRALIKHKRKDDPKVDEAQDGGRAGFREKLLFYMGIFLILLGGPGIALGSWLHDTLRIGIGEYQAFDVFGPWNRLVAAVGLIVLIVGIVFLILSLRLSRPSEVEKELDTLRES